MYVDSQGKDKEAGKADGSVLQGVSYRQPWWMGCPASQSPATTFGQPLSVNSRPCNAAPARKSQRHPASLRPSNPLPQHARLCMAMLYPAGHTDLRACLRPCIKVCLTTTELALQAMEIFFSIAHMTRPAHHIFHPRLLAAVRRATLSRTSTFCMNASRRMQRLAFFRPMPAPVLHPHRCVPPPRNKSFDCRRLPKHCGP